MKTYGGMELEAHSFLTSALNGVVRLTRWPLYPRGKSHQYPLLRSLDGPQSRYGCNGEKRNINFPCRESNPGRPARNLLNILVELPRLLAADQRSVVYQSVAAL
jgi:hypothetical protein